MRRFIALLVMFAALVAAVGCNHIGGKCDCGFNPSDYPITGPTNPYPAAPVAKPVPPPGNE
ncbi:MAG: hypothetical protein L0241_07645 [Planctomycetia bacterium]|nr:hypothetical protein [Planctomycetia bacterium]